MKRVSETELQLAVAIPPPLPKMTRREKLLRWAELIRTADHALRLYHNLEYTPREVLHVAEVRGTSCAFNLAASDPVFIQEGLTTPTIGGVMGFMELTQAQLHEFSCDCGGYISNSEMADRIAGLA